MISTNMVKINGLNFSIKPLNLFSIIRPNEHPVLHLDGTIENPTATIISEKMEGRRVSVIGGNDKFFCGNAQNATITASNDSFNISIEIISRSFEMDREPKSRSFQNVTMKYSDVVKEILKDYPKILFKFTVGEDVAIGKPLIQYKETDWQFIKRLASHFNTSVSVENHTEDTNIWFGVPHKQKKINFANKKYKVSLNDKYYNLGGASSPFNKAGLISYICDDYENYSLGEIITLSSEENYIYHKTISVINEIVVFSYRFASKQAFAERTFYNEKATGLSLSGTVLETAGETVKIHLDIDKKQDTSTAYPYNWTPLSGNFMYLMPKVGTTVSLVLNNYDERTAAASDSIRKNGSDCGELSDYNNRFLTTEHGKRMYLAPETMGYSGTSGSTTPLHISMDDAKYIIFESHKSIHMIAAESITIEAPDVILDVPAEIHALQTSQFSGDLLSAIFPRGTGVK